MSKWETLKNYINSKEVGTIITRKEILKFNVYKRTSSYGTTIDNYRRCLKILGILENEDRGKYKICCHIRKNLTSSELKKIAYGGFRQWFNDVKAEGGLTTQ